MISGFGSLRESLEFLEREKQLVRIRKPVDPDLEMASIHNRVFQAAGPAVYYESVKGSPFPAVSNLFGTYERALKLLDPGIERVRRLIALSADPGSLITRPGKAIPALPALVHALPMKTSKAPVLCCRTRISDLPQIRCWPGDGGAFILLPQVFTQDPGRPGIGRSNLGMYRIQMSGGEYVADREIGLHYQIHRGIGNHHARALALGKPLRISIFVGGPPAHTLAAVMPLPEGMPEVAFAGALASRRFRYAMVHGAVVSADADFCITGRVVMGRTKPEGPFGDHLGYYSLAHGFPYLAVESVFHRKDAVWPFTVVGRPPREDSIFGQIIHDLTRPAVSSTIPGVAAVNAVDASGVHPLLLVKAHERYVPYQENRPREILTLANAILGSGQLSLAKYLLICAHEDDPGLDVHNEPAFFRHFLERVDFRTDLHFQTCTTMDTLDYSAQGLNQGSKVVMAAAGPQRRALHTKLPGRIFIPEPFSDPMLAGPGILVVKAPAFTEYDFAQMETAPLLSVLEGQEAFLGLPLIVLVDDAREASSDFATFLWITFTRSNPSHDIYGVGSATRFKHWECSGPLVIDARLKPFHAQPLVPDASVEKKVDDLARRGGDLYGII
ncbi:MAG: UbiD family decarboxylase [Pseudomonadota bacterium]